jgi:hypothetical protein
MSKAAAALVVALSVLFVPVGVPAQKVATAPLADPSEEPNNIVPQRYPSGAPEVLYKKATCYGQLVTWYLDLEKAYPDYFKTFWANQVYGTGGIPGQGGAACAPQMGNPYDTLFIRMTNEKTGVLNKPEVFFMGPLHGDEKTGANGNYWFANWTMRTAFDPQYADPFWTPYTKWMLDHREVYFEASHNPYGYDATVRGDVDGDDLNREGDMDCCGATNKGLWGAVNGKTSREFVGKHQIRAGTDWHGGAHALLTPWKSTHDTVQATSPISGRTQSFAPPDFFYYNVGMHRAADLVGPYGGTMGASNIGPTPEVLGYQSPGALSGWAYGADTTANPIEAPYVKQGPYPGAGAFWPTFELSSVKNAAESEYGGDITIKYGGQARRFMLFMTDLAQPHLHWDAGSVANNSQVKVGEQITFKWIVYGGLTADNTLIQYGTDPDPVKNPQSTTKSNLNFDHKYQGGTVWDNAKDGVMQPYIWTETITLTQPGDYYFTAKAMLDQVYDTIAGEAEYGKNKTYLRLLKERLKEGWTETINGEDGAETMVGRKWWYSPVIKLTASGNVSGPIITSTAPGNGAQNVPTSTKVDITWSKAMNRSSAEAAFTITPAAAGSWAWGGGDTVQTLTPSGALTNDTSYKVDVATTAKDAGGNAMASPYTFNFRTVKGGGNQSDTTPPTIIKTLPANGATGVARDSPVTITFSEPMDKSVSENATGVTPGRNLVYSWSGNDMTFKPDLKWDSGCEVLVDVNTPARDLAGNQLQAKHTFKFTAEGDCVNKIPPKVYFTVPEDKATNVDVKTQIKVGFTRDMKALTLDTAFVVNPVLKFNVVASGYTATLEHADDMKAGTKYTVTVSKEATSTEGLTLGTPYTFTFTTASGGPPPPPPPPNGTGGTGSSPLGGMLPVIVVLVIMAIAVATVAAILAAKRKRDKQAQQAQQAYQQQWQWQQQGPPGGWG